MPVTGVDLSNGPNQGTLYVNWIDGAEWRSRRLCDVIARRRRNVSVDPADGSENIVFYDRRGTEGELTRLTLARSTDGGRTFVNYQIDVSPFVCDSKVFSGDYSGICAFNGRVVPIFMHFIEKKKLAISVALFRFKPSTQEPLP